MKMIFSDFLSDSLKALATVGKLKLLDGNYLYLDVSNDYIHTLYPLLENNIKEKVSQPNYFTDEKNHIGAHASVIYPEEKSIQNISGCLGKYYDFTVQGLFVKDVHAKRYYALKIQSPELLTLRQQNQLPNELNFRGNNISFHITLAVLRNDAEPDSA
jgi:hypothetical protein